MLSMSIIHLKVNYVTLKLGAWTRVFDFNNVWQALFKVNDMSSGSISFLALGRIRHVFIKKMRKSTAVVISYKL